MTKIAYFKDGYVLKLDNIFRFCRFIHEKRKGKYRDVDIIRGVTIDINEGEARRLGYALLQNTRKFNEIK